MSCRYPGGLEQPPFFFFSFFLTGYDASMELQSVSQEYFLTLWKTTTIK